MKLVNISKRYDNKVIFDNLNLEIPENKITVIIGSSGTGKTTLLNIIGGLTSYDGEIKDAPNKLSFVFSEPRLVNNLTVFGNLEYVLKHIETDKNKRKEIIENILTAVELIEYKDYYPRELSTGMAQRVAIARAFIVPSDMIIMDEAFRGLDIGLKNRLMNYFIRLWNDNKKTVVTVTHDISEAIYLADRIYLFTGSPVEIALAEDVESEQISRDIMSNEYAELKNRIYKHFI
ncbi:MAG: ABC transporter ATP-binding protein [Clostridia bacterium]|nr:ABC transporter ATP-binding protein [Clostridia bacterium]